MPEGLQTWDASGRMMLDTTTKLARVLEVFDSGTANGSRIIARLNTGEPFIFVEENSADLPHLAFYSMPNVTYSGSTVSWSFVDIRDPYMGGMAPRRSVRISVGVF